MSPTRLKLLEDDQTNRVYSVLGLLEWQRVTGELRARIGSGALTLDDFGSKVLKNHPAEEKTRYISLLSGYICPVLCGYHHVVVACECIPCLR